VDGTYVLHGRGMCTGYWREGSKERYYLEDEGVDGRVESVWILGRLVGGLEWIQLAQDRAGGGLV
jgi:hypothetical protein